MAADVDLYSPQLPADDPSGWSREDYITALNEVDRAATWAKVRIAGSMAVRYGEELLHLAAHRTGIALSTLKNWRKVDKAFPAEKYGRPYFSVGVAEAFCALRDRDKLVSREQPWTVAAARELAAGRRNSGKGGGPSAVVSITPSTAVPNTNTADSADSADGTGTAPVPQQPPGGQEDAARQPEPADPGNASPEITVVSGDTPAAAALPEDELERLREETKRAVALELKANFQDLWNDLATECEARQAQVEALLARVRALEEERDALEAELGRLRAGRNGTCPEHGKTALVTVCPACAGIQEERS